VGPTEAKIKISNETIKLQSNYTLKVRTVEGKILGISIIDSPNTKKESLDILIDKGSKISFPQGNWYEAVNGKHYKFDNETYFHENTRFGNKRANRIRIED